MKRLLALLILLAACGRPVHVGRVDDHHYSPQYDWMMPLTTCTGGQYSTCMTTYIPMTEPEEWSIHVVEDPCPPDVVSENKCGTQWVDSWSPEIWKTYPIGSKWTAK